MTEFNYNSIVFALLILSFAIFQNLGSDTDAVAQSVEFKNNTQFASVSLIMEKEVFAENLSRYTGVVEEPVIQNDFEIRELAPQEIVNEKEKSSTIIKETIIRTVNVNPEPVRPAVIPPRISAVASLVKEIGSPYSFFIEERKLRWPLASITKLMTAVVASEHIPPDVHIRFSESAIATEGIAGSFNTGDVFSARDAIHAMLIISSNDAATAIAEFYGTEKFIREMQNTAARIGMLETAFFDATGFSSLNKTTVEDLERLVVYILKNHKDIFDITAKKSIDVTEISTQTVRRIGSNNIFSGEPNFIGGKTGYTDEAQGNLVSLFSDGVKQYLIIVFGSNDRFSETDALFKWATKIN
jgi:D-alanyl-D-alanine carboxypeptidase